MHVGFKVLPEDYIRIGRGCVIWLVPVEGCVDEWKVVEEFYALLQTVSGSVLQ